MLSRGKVALIVAGAAVAHDPPYIGKDLFGVAILMTIVTTLIAPPLIVRSFASGRSGLRRPETQRPVPRLIAIEGAAPGTLPLVRTAILAAFEKAG